MRATNMAYSKTPVSEKINMTYCLSIGQWQVLSNKRLQKEIISIYHGNSVIGMNVLSTQCTARQTTSSNPKWSQKRVGSHCVSNMLTGRKRLLQVFENFIESIVMIVLSEFYQNEVQKNSTPLEINRSNLQFTVKISKELEYINAFRVERKIKNCRRIEV